LPHTTPYNGGINWLANTKINLFSETPIFMRSAIV